MNNYIYAVLCYFVTLGITNYGCYGEEFIPLYGLNSVQKVDKPDGTTDSPITDGVILSWSRNNEYRLHATGYDNIETFPGNKMKVIFMVGDFVKIIVLDTGNVWLCQFPAIKWVTLFYNAASLGDLTNDDVPLFKIDFVNQEGVEYDSETITDVGLYMKNYHLSQSDRKMFILEQKSQKSIVMVFLSGSFSIEKVEDQLRFTFKDVESRSCTMEIRDNGESNVETVYNALLPYARRT